MSDLSNPRPPALEGEVLPDRHEVKKRAFTYAYGGRIYAGHVLDFECLHNRVLHAHADRARNVTPGADECSS